jgi:hypothetical protein
MAPDVTPAGPVRGAVGTLAERWNCCYCRLLITLENVVLVFAMAALLVLSQAQTPAQTPASPPREATSNRPADGVICRRERIVGSNRSQRICTTSRERQLAEDGAQRTLERHSSAPQTCDDPARC